MKVNEVASIDGAVRMTMDGLISRFDIDTQQFGRTFDATAYGKLIALIKNF